MVADRILQWGRLAGLCAIAWACVAQAQEPLRISGLIPSGQDVQSFKISPDGNNVAFVANVDGTGPRLYIVPSNGGTRIDLSGSKSSIGTYDFSPDGTSMVFLANIGNSIETEVYSVPVSGGPPSPITGVLVSGGKAIEFRISPDSSRVVFIAKKQSAFLPELYSVPIAGGSVAKLSGTNAGAAGVGAFEINPASTRVVFRADHNTAGTNELYVTPIDMESIVQISRSPIVAGGDVGAFKISANGARVVYVGDMETDTIPELYSVPIAGGMSTKLSGTLAPGGKVSTFELSPNSQSAVYRADKDTAGTVELYRVALTGGNSIKSSGSMVAGGSVTDFDITPDSARIVFRANRTDPARFDLFSVPILTTSPVLLSKTGNLDRDVQKWAISPDSSSLTFYTLNHPGGDLNELFVVPVAGGAPVQVATGATIAQFSPDSRRFIFRLPTTAATTELFLAPVAGSPLTKVSGALVAGASGVGAVGLAPSFAYAPLGNRIVFLAEKLSDSQIELFAVTPGTLALDIDGDGKVEALTDGLLLMRWHMGMRGTALIADALSPEATRNTADLVEDYLLKLTVVLGPE